MKYVTVLSQRTTCVAPINTKNCNPIAFSNHHAEIMRHNNVRTYFWNNHSQQIFYLNKKEILKEFGRNLRAERNRVGLSQEQLAEKIGVSYGQVIGTIERGETNTSLSVIVAILNELDLDFAQLFDRKKFNS